MNNSCTICKIKPRAISVTRCADCNSEYMRRYRQARGAKQRSRRKPENRALITPSARAAIAATEFSGAETVEQFLQRGGNVMQVQVGASGYRP